MYNSINNSRKHWHEANKVISRAKYNLFFNALLFQCCWFLAIFSHWYWAVIPLLIMIAHLYLESSSKLLDLKLFVVIAFSGITIDTIFSVNNIYTFNEGLLLSDRSIPIWLCILWGSFALTLNHSLGWMLKKGPLFILGCAIAGPVSYVVGRTNGVISFSDDYIILIAFEWILIALITLRLVESPLRDLKIIKGV